MSAKILAAMQKMDASLTLIADKFANGSYESEADLQTALASVNTAKSNATKAYNLMAKSATQGRKGILAMATDAFDQQMTAVQQCQVKANLLADAIQAELDEMEENQVTDEIQAMDFDQPDETDTNLDTPVDVTDNGRGDVIEQEEIVPEDSTASTVAEEEVPPVEEEEEFPAEEVPPVEEEEIPEEVPTEEIDDLDIEAEEEAGDTDLLDMGGDDSLFEEEEEEVPTDVEANSATADKVALRQSATAAAAGSRGNSLESCWDFRV